MAKLTVLAKAGCSFKPSDGIITAACFDGKSFFVCSDNGPIQRVPLRSDEGSSGAEEVYKAGGHVTSIDVTRDANSPSVFAIGLSDGNVEVCSVNWRLEKSFMAHPGGVTQVAFAPDGLSVATAGEDGTVKAWSRNGALRSTVASCGGAVASLAWDCTGKMLFFTSGGNVTVRSVSLKQDHTQFRAHRRVVSSACVNRATNEILTASEDGFVRLYDSEGRQLAESPRFDIAASSVAFVGGFVVVGTTGRLFLLDTKLRIISHVQVSAGALICPVFDEPRALIAGGSQAQFVSIVGKRIIYRDIEAVLEAAKKIVVTDLKNGTSEPLMFNDLVIDFALAYGNMVAITQGKVQVYKAGQWGTPLIIDVRESVVALAQASTQFVIVTPSGAQIVGYDGRVLARVTDSRVRWDLVSREHVALSPAVFVVVSPDGRRHIFAFATSSGQTIANEPYQHVSEVRSVRCNQAATVQKARFGFTDSNGDLTLCRLVTANPRVPPAIEGAKLTNFVDEFRWHSTHDVVVCRSGDRLATWAAPSAVFFTPDLVPQLKVELRTLIDVAAIDGFDGTRIFVVAKDGSCCVVPIAPFLIILHEAVEAYKSWKMVLQVCRTAADKSLWAVCAAVAVQNGELDAAIEAYAALQQIDRVVFLKKVKRMKSPAARNAMVAVLQNRISDAEEILVQSGCTYRAIKMDIALGRWTQALAVAKRASKLVDVVVAYRTRFCRELEMEEPDSEFRQLGQIELAAVKSTIKAEKASEGVAAPPA